MCNGRLPSKVNEMPRGVKNTPVDEVDPFAPEQDNVPAGDEAQTETPPWEVQDNETDVNSAATKPEEKKTVIEFGGGDRLSVTLKQHKGYEAAWIVLKGDTPADILSTMEDPNFKKLMEWTKKASETFQEGSAPVAAVGNTSGGSSSSQNGSQGRTYGKPAGATEGPWGVQTCEHGTMVFKSGQGDDGVWQGYFCPVPKGQFPRCAKNKYVK